MFLGAYPLVLNSCENINKTFFVNDDALVYMKVQHLLVVVDICTQPTPWATTVAPNHAITIPDLREHSNIIWSYMIIWSCMMEIIWSYDGASPSCFFVVVEIEACVDGSWLARCAGCPAKSIQTSAKPIPAYQHTCLLLLLGERAPVLSWKKSGQANQHLLCPSQGTKQWCNLRFNIYFLGEHLGSAGLQRELIHANPTRSGRFPERFCIFWLAQVTTPCNFSRSSTFKVPLQLQDPLKKNQFIEQNAPWHQRLSIVNVFGQYLQFLKSSWGWDEDELEMLMHLNRRKCGAY